MLFDPASNPRIDRSLDVETTSETELLDDLLPLRPEDRRPTGAKARLLDSVLLLAATESYEELGPVRIADRANVPLDTFLETFDGRDECFLAAFDMIGDELLAIAADPVLLGGDWAGALPTVLAAIMRHLAENPVYAQTIAYSAYAAGPLALERNLQLALDLASVLTEGAPRGGRRDTLNEWIAGAIWQMIQGYGTQERAHMLPALTDSLARVMLTPLIGVQAAIEQLAGAPPSASAAPEVSRRTCLPAPEASDERVCLRLR
jgi:AcrR family transcriptional regulator